MTKLYGTGWRNEEQLSAVFTTEDEAREHVMNVLAGYYSWKTYDELYELCDAEAWSRDSLILPYGIVEIEKEGDMPSF